MTKLRERADEELAKMERTCKLIFNGKNNLYFFRFCLLIDCLFKIAKNAKDSQSQTGKSNPSLSMDKLKAKAADKKRPGFKAGDKQAMLGSSVPREELYPHQVAGKDISDANNDITTTEWYKWSFEI